MIWKAGQTEILQSDNDFLDYQVDFQYFLASDSDTITGITITSDPTVTVSNISNTTTAVTFWMSLTADGLITLTVTTALGRIIERCISAKVEVCA